MKKMLVLLVLMVSTVTYSSAQKGDVVVGVQGSYNSYFTKVGAGVKAQYYFFDDFRAGGAFNYCADSEMFNVLSVDLTAEYLIRCIADGFSIYPSVGMSFSSWDDLRIFDGGANLADKNEYRFSPIVGGGAEYFFTDSFGLFAEYEYQFIKDYSQSVVSLGVNFKF